MKFNITLSQFCLGTVFGAVIACSPTKFNPTASTPNTICDSSVTSCIVEQSFINLTQNFEVGSGKVDILFVSDNSASMSQIQIKLKDRFSGFIQNLDSKKIDYRVAATTTDLTTASQSKLIPMGNSKTFLTNADTNRVSLFYAAILRTETLQCENLILGMFNTYGTSFESQPDYVRLYPTRCPSPDTRGINKAFLAVSENADSFIRADANLNVIVISNDDVRQGRYKLNSKDSRFLPLEANDKSETFISMMQEKYPNKYWDFNSIVVKDTGCKDLQVLKNPQGQIVSDASGPAISGGLGYEYAMLSNSAAKDIDGSPRPRGRILDICENDYANHFTDMATQISQEARMINLKCVPNAAPMVNYISGTAVPATLYTWSTDKITFKKGSEGSQVTVHYKCYTGPT